MIISILHFFQIAQFWVNKLLLSEALRTFCLQKRKIPAVASFLRELLSLINSFLIICCTEPTSYTRFAMNLCYLRIYLKYLLMVSLDFGWSSAIIAIFVGWVAIYFLYISFLCSKLYSLLKVFINYYIFLQSLIVSSFHYHYLFAKT